MMNKEYRLLKATWLPLAIVIFLVARYAAAPVTGFVLDDWNYLRFAQMWPDGWEVAKQGFVKDLNRPVSTMVMSVGFYLFDLNLWPYMLLLIVGHGLILYLSVALIHRWNGGDLRQSFIFGVMLAVFPLLTESFYFPMLAFVMAVVGVPLYLLSAYGVTRYAETAERRWLLLGWISYGVVLFWYEAAILLPAAFAVLLFGRRSWREFLVAMGGFAFLFVLYFSWRTTEAFGLLNSTTPEHMKASASGVDHIIVNAKEMVRWWVGSHGIHAWRNGLSGFLSMAPGKQVGLLVVNLLLCGAAICMMVCCTGRKQRSTGGIQPMATSRFLILMGVWFAVTSVPALMSYVVSRLLLFPSIAFLAVLARFLSPVGNRILIPVGACLLLVAMIACQGTNQQWRDAAQAYRGVYDALRAERAQWVGKEILLFDSRELREKKGDPDPIRAVAFHGNASMYRGSGLREMIWRAGRIWPKGKGRLDVEYRAELTEGQLWLHRRHDPDGPVVSRYPLSDVHVLELPSP